jgi:aspartyl-tRNA(Asn)/glutamyl-tRNA(Gln) amidotransferase subunit A
MDASASPPASAGALHALGATELVAAYRSGELSPVEVTRDILDHISRWEPHLCATWLLRPELALQQAQASEARWLRQAPLTVRGHTLDGVPVTIKDNIATQGDPTPLGTAAVPLTPAAADAPPASRLREAGAVIVCKTTMPDYGMLSSGLSTFHKLARNPWNRHKTPGGSSSGAGAAAAAGYGPLHIGTDIGGSLRLPAGWCGIFSLKPSLGRIPIDPPYTGRAAGPMTRTVGDAALMMATLSLPDARDSMNLPWQDIAWQQFDQGTDWLRGKRVGLLLDAGCGLAVDPEITAAVQAAALLFAQAGAHVEPMRPFMTREMLRGLDLNWRMRSRIDLNNLPPAERGKVLPYIRTWAESAKSMTAEETFIASTQSYAVRVATVKACAPYDLVLSPTSPVLAFDAELPSPTNDPLNGLEHIGFTVPFNMSEQPACSINCGYSASGLPIGLQIAGPRFDDLGVLQAARAYELLRQPQRPWPLPPA